MLYDNFGHLIKVSEDISKFLERLESNPSIMQGLLTRKITTFYSHGCTKIFNRLWFDQKEFRGAGIWSFSGNGRTNSEGQEGITLNDYLCISRLEKPDKSIQAGVITEFQSFVASPNLPVPALLTYSIEVESTPFYFNPEGNWPFEDLEISYSIDLLTVRILVYSWDLDGAPKPYIPYSWNCVTNGGYRIS